MTDPSARLPDRSDVDALKAAVDLAAVVESCGVALRRVGRNQVGKCPFHEESDGSFVVNGDRQLWSCFGCQSGGDVLSFLQLKEGLEFPQALERLRAIVGTVPPPSPARAQQSVAPAEANAPLPGGFSRAELLGRVADLCVKQLHESREARAYLLSRGLAVPEALEAFRIGFCDGQSLLKTLPHEGALRDAMLALGVVTAQNREHFSGCITVPLEHPDLGVVGLYGRKIAPNARIRHLYLPGAQRGVLNWQALKSSPAVVIAESVLDALSLWIAGLREATCLYGVHGLPRDLEELLVRFGTRQVSFCLDADDAGREASARLAAQLSRRGVRCLHVELPPGKDPNQVLIEHGPDALREAATKVQPPPSAPDAPSAAAQFEATEEGFIVHFGEVAYRVTPRAPFSGKLRVVLRPSWGERSFVDTVDLFSSRARTMFAGQACRALEIARLEVERHLLAILEETERWVAALAEASGAGEEKSKQPPTMSSAEREEALVFLRQPELAAAVLEDMRALGAVGEEHGKLLAYLIGISRKLERPLSGIIISQSGAGKSSLAELVEVLTPPEDIELYSRLSPQALGYMAKDALKRKLLILEERVGAEAADYAIRVLQSRQRLSQAVVTKDPFTGKMSTTRFDVEGPIAYLETTTNPRINHENATRCFEITLDESEEQTQRIHRRQRMARTPHGLVARSRSDEICRRHHNAQRLLEPVRVVIPYVDRLSFPSRWLRTRRDHERFLCLIEAVAFLHQHGRERGTVAGPSGDVPYIVATVEDYRLAYDLARDVLGITLHELTRGAQDLIEAVEAMVADTGKLREAITFTRRQLREYTGWHDHRLRDALQELVEMEYLGLVGGGSQGRTCEYQLRGRGNGAGAIVAQLTTPDELERLLAG